MKTRKRVDQRGESAWKVGFCEEEWTCKQELRKTPEGGQNPLLFLKKIQVIVGWVSTRGRKKLEVITRSTRLKKKEERKRE